MVNICISVDNFVCKSKVFDTVIGKKLDISLFGSKLMDGMVMPSSIFNSIL